MILVIVMGSTRTVSFQPRSLAVSSTAGPVSTIFRQLIDRKIEGPAIQNLKADEVQMDRVGIIGEINERPDLGGVQHWSLGHWHIPMRAIQQHDVRTAQTILIISNGQFARDNRCAFLDAGYRAQHRRQGTGISGLLFRNAKLHDYGHVRSQIDLFAGLTAEIQNHVGALSGTQN